MTLRKKLIAARFSKSRAKSKEPLLSKSIARRTGVSVREMSLIGLGWPSTINSKSSTFRLVMATPRESITVVGTGTRCELTRTTSSTSFDGVSFDLVDAGIGGGGATVLGD